MRVRSYCTECGEVVAVLDYAEGAEAQAIEDVSIALRAHWALAHVAAPEPTAVLALTGNEVGHA